MRLKQRKVELGNAYLMYCNVSFSRSGKNPALMTAATRFETPRGASKAQPWTDFGDYQQGSAWNAYLSYQSKVCKLIFSAAPTHEANLGERPGVVFVSVADLFPSLDSPPLVWSVVRLMASWSIFIEGLMHIMTVTPP